MRWLCFIIHSQVDVDAVLGDNRARDFVRALLQETQYVCCVLFERCPVNDCHQNALCVLVSQFMLGGDALDHRASS